MRDDDEQANIRLAHVSLQQPHSPRLFLRVHPLEPRYAEAEVASPKPKALQPALCPSYLKK